MKIAVIGCGAIGGLFLGYLSGKGNEVSGVVKDVQKEALLTRGLRIEGVRGENIVKVNVDTRLKEPVDLAVLAVKIDDISGVIAENSHCLKNAVVLTTQNGVRAEYMLENYFPRERIITGIVMFGATYYSPDRVVHNFEGDLIIGSVFDIEPERMSETRNVLSGIFNVEQMDNILGAKYLKVFINLNNCIPAVLGISMQEAFSDMDIAGLAIRLNREAYDVVKKKDINLVGLPSYPKERIEGLVSMEVEVAAALFSKIMTSLSKEPLYGSILQSIKRNRKSEIDYINGEIVRLAADNGFDAPLNRRIVEIVHRIEETKKFLSKDELFSEIKA